MFLAALINSSHSSSIFVFSVILLYILSKEVVVYLSHIIVRMKRGKMYLLISPVENQSVRASGNT